MDSSRLFLLLVLLQGAHSVEETMGRLWDQLLPARRIALSVADDPATGFILVNAALFLFGVLCWWHWVRPGRAAASACILLWMALGLFNAIGHGLLAWRTGGVVAGYLTALPMFPLALWLGLQWSREAAAGGDTMT